MAVPRAESIPPIRVPVVTIIAAVVLGAAVAAHEITNTSIGWHLASGRWILEHRAVPTLDPFSFTAAGTPWIDHEWLFQVIVCVADQVAGPPALVVLRMVAVASLSVLLLMIGLRSGLSPPLALVVSGICVWGASPRFFVRPELVTLVVVPAAVWLYLERARWGPRRAIALLAILLAVGANAHAAVLVTPVLLAGLWLAEVAHMMITRRPRWREAGIGAAAVAVAAVAPVLNPYGWRLFTIPVTISHLVALPHIPNPEWTSPSPIQAPSLYAAVAAGLVILVLKERHPARWLLLVMAAALAVRHVRNLGLLFVLLPLAIAPALARWPAFSSRDRGSAGVGSVRWQLAAVAGILLLALSVLVAPWPRFGFGYSDRLYPAAACDFLERTAFPRGPMYNDVNFGGFLIGRDYPDHQVFIDDRNEIHEPLLGEIYGIFGRSDVRAWQRMLDRYGIATAMVRYHPRWRTTSPAGAPLGQRGFSALWFPDSRWALVFWDDVAMVFVDRRAVAESLLARYEYRVVRPDDGPELARRLVEEPAIRATATAELYRKLADDPSCRRARGLLDLLAAPPG